MGKRFTIDRKTTVSEGSDDNNPSPLEVIGGLIIWLFIIAACVNGCSGM